MWHKHKIRIGQERGRMLVAYCIKCKKIFWWEWPDSRNIEDLHKVEIDTTVRGMRVIEKAEKDNENYLRS